MRNWLLLLWVAIGLAGCAGSGQFVPSGDDAYAFKQRAVSKTESGITLTAAVPTEQETRDLTGLDLYGQGIQPVWLRLENNSSSNIWLLHKSVDPDYFSPLEVAYMNRGPFSKDSRIAMERWFWESGIERIVTPGASTEGFIYTHLTPGLKGFNTQVVSTQNVVDMTFFIEMPGFRPDYMDIRFRELYKPDEIRTAEPSQLLVSLPEGEPCCTANEAGLVAGPPFNMAWVGNGETVHRALFRAGWNETARDDPNTASARNHYYRGRPPDGVFYKERSDGDERRELRIWATPYRAEDQPIWVVQAVLDLAPGESFQLDPDLDSSRNYAAQSFWYGQSLDMLGIAPGATAHPLEQPGSSFDGESWFTDGLRLLLWLTDDPISIGEVRSANQEYGVYLRERP